MLLIITDSFKVLSHFRAGDLYIFMKGPYINIYVERFIAWKQMEQDLIGLEDNDTIIILMMAFFCLHLWGIIADIVDGRTNRISVLEYVKQK